MFILVCKRVAYKNVDYVKDWLHNRAFLPFYVVARNRLLPQASDPDFSPKKASKFPIFQKNKFFFYYFTLLTLVGPCL